ncbi:MAG TPA: alpha/beta fold hydrolase [Stellaceae bacterium]|jgi:surfactin synthase thioesterase subunit
MSIADPRAATNPWINIPRKVAAPRLRLFCAPYAGGAAGIYRQWPTLLPPDIEVVALQLPGRERRSAETPLTDMPAVVAETSAAMLPLLDRPFAFFGHSMGAIIAYETVRLLTEIHRREPACLFVSARRAPHLPARKAPIHHLPDEEFIAEIGQLNGTPREVLAHPDLMELMTPMLRGDFKLIETYAPAAATPLSCRIVGIGGEDDNEANREEIAAWRQWTTGAFRQVMLPGNHFFLTAERDLLLSIVAQELQPPP